MNSSSILDLTQASLDLEFYACVVAANFGILSNILNIIVSMREKIQEIHLMGLYYTFMSIFNILSIVCTLYLSVFSQTIGNAPLYSTSIYACLFIPYFTRVFNAMTPWLNVIISYDRIQAFNINYRKAFLYKKRNVKLMILFFVVLACGVNAANLFFHLETQTQVNPITNQTTTVHFCVASNLVTLIRDVIPILTRIVLPLLTQTVLNIILIKKMINYRKNVNLGLDDSRLRKERRFTFTVVVMNVVFVIGEIPFILGIILINIYGYNPTTFISTTSSQSAIASFAYNVGVLSMMFVSYSLTFFVNFFTNKKYRLEVKKLLTFNLKDFKDYLTTQSSFK